MTGYVPMTRTRQSSLALQPCSAPGQATIDSGHSLPLLLGVSPVMTWRVADRALAWRQHGGVLQGHVPRRELLTVSQWYEGREGPATVILLVIPPAVTRPSRT
jgi:hypothetical protein